MLTERLTLEEAAVLRKAEKRFWGRVEKSEDCWIWKGYMTGRGYGSLWFSPGEWSSRSIHAHRFSWMIHYGAIPKNLCVLHRCDVRTCVNPDHLFIGTPRDNSLDMCKKGRCGNMILTEIDVSNIKARITQSCLTQRELAEFYGVSEAAINKIKSGSNWSWVDVASIPVYLGRPRT